MKYPRIKIYSRSMNATLYARSMFFIDLPYPKVRLLNTTAEGYLETLILDEEADMVINIDEDAFVSDLETLKLLLDFVIENEYINCGMPDGGVVHLRRMNPLVTNPYFNILNTKEIRKKFHLYNESDFNEHKVEFERFLPVELMRGEYKYVYYEPYYPLLIWLSQNFKTLYLDALDHQDGESTILLDQHNTPFLIHTWYSRFYNKDKFHTNRIDNIVKECGASSGRHYNVSFSEFLRLRQQYYITSLIEQLVRLKKKIKNH